MVLGCWVWKVNQTKFLNRMVQGIPRAADSHSAGREIPFLNGTRRFTAVFTGAISCAS
jgi:hypothetical protein